ncbi:MAG: amidohydrolase family protein [Planctomycetota bacterium]
MIVDCHTTVASPPDRPHAPAVVAPVSQADENRHRDAVDPVDKAIVLAFKSSYLGAEISNQVVAEYVRRNPEKMIGFAGIDPTDRDWLEELRVAQDELRLKGVVVSPEMQNYHPADTRAMRLYEQCVRRGMPILFEQNHRHAGAKMEFAQPMLLDEVAREFPDLRVIIARLGHPWVDQAIVLLGKHPHVYADVAGLLPQTWLSYTALLAASEYGVMDKLLFGSDYPYRSPAACIEALYSINQFTQAGTLKSIPREQLRGIVERDALNLLGIGPPAARNARSKSTIFAQED